MSINFPTFYDSETPSGSINGSNLSFSLAHVPYGNVDLFWNGLIQQPGLDYSLSGNNITFLVQPPQTSNSLLADYIVNDGTSETPTELFIDWEVPSGLTDGTNTTFDLGHVPVSGSVKLYKNGVRQDPSSDYSVSVAVVTMTVAPQAGDDLTVFYRTAGSSDGVVGFQFSEELSGVLDGGNNIFFSSQVSFPPESLRVYYAGQLQDHLADQYNQVFNSVGFVVPPTASASLLASYRTGSEVPPNEMATFPNLSSGSAKVYGPLLNQALAMYPATLTNSYATRVIRFVSDQEQRFTVRASMFYGILEYSGVNQYDMNVIMDFFNSQLGKYAVVNVATPSESTTFSITINGVTYENCAFDQDTIEPQLGRGETYSFQLAIKQLVSSPSATG